MSRAKQTIYLILCGVAAFVLGIIVVIANREWTTDLLAAGLIVGGVAMIVIALPTINGK